MKLSRRQGFLFVSMVVALAAICLMQMPVFAQCPLCKLAVENSTQGQSMGRGLKLGILVLLVPPVTVFCSIFIIAIKRRKDPAGQEENQGT